jgi:hypothetical protein
MWRREGILLADVSEEPIASIFRVEADSFTRFRLSLKRLKLSAHAGSSFVDCFYPEDGGDTFLRNVG